MIISCCAYHMGYGAVASLASIRRARRAAMVAKAAIGVARTGYNAYKRYKSSSTDTKMDTGGTGGVVTTQFDHRTLYKRRHASRAFRRKARQYRKFTRKVLSAVDKENERQIALVVSATSLSATAGNQNMSNYGTTMYGSIYTQTSYRDLSSIVTGSGASTTVPKKIYCRNARLEAVVKNTDSTNACYIECYYWRCYNDAPLNSGLPTSILSAGLDATQLGGSNMTTSTYGVNPFHSKDFCQYFKIWKKDVTLLPAGTSMDITLNDNRHKVLETGQITDVGMKKHWAQGILICFYGVPDSLGVPVASSISISSTRTYTMTVPGIVRHGNTVLAD